MNILVPIPHCLALVFCILAQFVHDGHAGSLALSGINVVLNDIPYYISPIAIATIPLNPAQLSAAAAAAGLIPITVVETSSFEFGQAELAATISNYSQVDDVWQPGFLEALFVQHIGGQRPNYLTTLSSNLTVNGTNVISVIYSRNASSVPPGPYFASITGSLYQAYRLYSDFAGSFTQPLIQQADGSYAPIPAAIAGIQAPAVGVPSRLYFTKTADKPLAGVRLGVKDIFDIAGVKTSDGNRAYYMLYPPRTINSLPVQRLVDAGAVIVGKMKTSQFANGEEATCDWVDYHSPFNPRGDGYQDPSSSSSGPGAGMASYPWLDLAMGSDTGGSIRGPSQVQGLFGNRPSHGLVDLTGVMPLAPELDTAGFLCRDPSIWMAAGKALYAGLEFYNQYPRTLYTVGFPTSADTGSDAVILDFLTEFEEFLSTIATPLNYTTLWESTRPNSADPDLDDLLNITYPILISKEQTMLVRDPFYADYAALHDGRLPFVDPTPLVRWAFGDSYPNSTLTDAITNKTTFMDWWSSNIAGNDSITCSNSLLLYVGDTADPNYRNQYSGPPEVPYGFSTSRVSPFTEVPDVVIPIGQANYTSIITNHTEFLPVTVDLLAAKGCDGMIFQLIEDLRRAGIVKVTQTGQTIYGGEVLF